MINMLNNKSTASVPTLACYSQLNEDKNEVKDDHNAQWSLYLNFFSSKNNAAKNTHKTEVKLIL